MNKKYFSIKMGVIFCIFCLIINSLSFVVFANEQLGIVSLTASKTAITRGDSFVLEWETTGADWIEIEGPDKLPEMVLPLSGNLEMFPLETTKYTLIAGTNDGNSVSKSVTVTVKDNLDTVAIDDFSADKYTITPGTDVELSWAVRNEEDIEIIDSNGASIDTELGATTVTVSPSETTTYTLIATAEGVSERASVTVNVEKSEEIPTVKINKFFADRTTVPEGSVVYLNWSAENAKEVSLDYLADNWYSTVDSSGSMLVIIYKSRTYELNATDEDGNTITATITIDVEAEEDTGQALISEFKSTSYSVYSGENFTLSWVINNALEATLTDSDNNTTQITDLKSGEVDLSIEKTTVYTLTAVGKNNLRVSAKITVEVKDPNEVRIVDFSASSYNVNVGQLVKLSWEVVNASCCFISTSDGHVLDGIPTSGSVYVTPNETRTYKLIAYAVNQEVKISEITIEVNDE